MRAITYDRYGSVDRLSMRNVPVPDVPDDGVLIRVVATSVNRSDWENLVGKPGYVRASAGLTKPKHPILGSDVAGVVEVVGPQATRFRVGDEVFGDLLFAGMGGFAEYVAVSERALLLPKPPGLGFDVAATLPQAGVLALQGLRANGSVTTGEKVLINGAGGGGGIFAIQLAKWMGAEVTAVDNNLKLETMKSVGADHVIDYTLGSYTKGSERYDRILDFVAHRSVLGNLRALERGGTYRVAGGPVRRLLKTVIGGGLAGKLTGRSMGMLIARPTRDDLAQVAELTVQGTIQPMIGEQFRLEETPEALRRLGGNRVLGKAVIVP